jgi:hypothetical protein
MAKKLNDVEPAYADLKVAQIDAEIAANAERDAELKEKRKLYAPHVTKRTSTTQKTS